MYYKDEPISREDPNAIEKLQAKLETCQKEQARMKEVNAYYRKNGTVIGCPCLDEAEALKLSERIKDRYPIHKQPYPSFMLTNNNAEINRIKKRIEDISYDRETGFVGWKFEGGEAVINEAICRLQLVFDKKPNEEQRYYLKLNGFVWSPNEGAWHRQLNRNAIYAADRMVFVRPIEGGHTYEIQPNSISKDKGDGAR